MKVLYISDGIYKIDGKGNVSRRNLELLKGISNEIEIINLNTLFEDKEKYTFKNVIGDIKIRSNINNKFLGLFVMLFNYLKARKKMLELIENKKYDFVFFDESLFGVFVKAISKKLSTKIVVFFHDIKLNYAKERFLKNFLYFPMLLSIIYNEKMSVKYGDTFITLNKREAINLKENYNVESSIELPVSLVDRYDLKVCNSIRNNKTNICTILFVGSALHYPNVQGVKWFIDNVMNNLNDNFKFNIVGFKFEDLKDQFYGYRNVNCIGTVDCIDDYYYMADVVVCPIFHGAGMKVKTAEALMFGKTIVATDEAVEGYNHKSNDIHICNNANEFITTLSNLDYNVLISKKNRNIYLNEFNSDIILDRFKKIIGELV